MVSPTPRKNAGFPVAACFQTCSQTPGCASPVRSPSRTKWNAAGAGVCASAANTAAAKRMTSQSRRIVVFSQTNEILADESGMDILGIAQQGLQQAEVQFNRTAQGIAQTSLNTGPSRSEAH